MIEYVNLLLLSTMFGSTCYVYYRLKKIFYLISIVMDSEILDKLTDLVSVGVITGKHYAKNSITKLNDRSDMEPVTQQQETVTKQKNPLRIEQGKKLVDITNVRKKN